MVKVLLELGIEECLRIQQAGGAVARLGEVRYYGSVPNILELERVVQPSAAAHYLYRLQ